jgi:23S rRNA-/tRNA-specific pseudouridylate synthase
MLIRTPCARGLATLVQVTAHDEGVRASRFCRGRLLVQGRPPPISLLHKLCRNRAIQLSDDGGKTHQRLELDAKLSAAQCLVVDDEAVQLASTPKHSPAPSTGVRLVHLHDDFMVIDKQAGIPMHQTGRAPGVVSRAFGLLPPPPQADSSSCPPFLVHRLDTDTSGLMVLARHRRAAAELSALFRDRSVVKIYRVALQRDPPSLPLTVSDSLPTDPLKDWRLRRNRADWASAVTVFFRSSDALPPSAVRDAELLDACRKRLSRHAGVFAMPLTGRKHQIRLHAITGLRSPIKNDSKYGPHARGPLGLTAVAIGFRWNGTPQVFTLGQDIHP